MGILSNHVPSIEPLRPGVVEVIENSGSQKFFGAQRCILDPRSVALIDGSTFAVSGGFATVHPNNRLTINVVEAAPLEDFSIEVGCTRILPDNSRSSSTILQAIRANLTEANKVASGNGSEADKMEARIEAEVYEALQHALAK